MRQLNYFLAFAILLLSAKLQGQSADEVNVQHKKPGGIRINELYSYEPATDPFKYRENERIVEFIELYNGSDTKVKTSDLYFTDDPSILYKYPIAARRIREKKIGPKKFLVVYINGSGKKKDAKSKVSIGGPYLYLVQKSGRDYRIVDSLHLSHVQSFPYTRYPDGKQYKTLDAITPGTENAYFNESQSLRIKGFSFQLGASTSSGKAFENTTRFTPSYSIGYFSRKNKYSLSIEKGLRYAVRGYGVSYHATVTTSKGTRKIDTEGWQTTKQFDYFYTRVHHLNRNFSFFYGGIISVRLGNRLKYNQKTTFTYFSTGTQVSSDTTYVLKNKAINLLDFDLNIGVRYHYKDKFDVSLSCMRSLVGVNTNMNQIINSGIYFSVNFPVWYSRSRVKIRTLLES